MQTMFTCDPGKNGAIVHWRGEIPYAAHSLSQYVDKDTGYLKGDELTALFSGTLKADWFYWENTSEVPPQCVGLFEKPFAIQSSSPQNTLITGVNYGILYASFLAATVVQENPWYMIAEEVTPSAWKRAMGLIAPKGATPTQKKEMSFDMAKKLNAVFVAKNAPRKKDDGIVEAFLLGEYYKEQLNAAE